MDKEKIYTSEDGTYRYTLGFDGELRVNALSHLPLDRLVAAMERLRDAVASGVAFEAVDSTTTGDKYTFCSWGLCADTPELYPDKQDRIWPEEDKVIHGMVSPLNRADEHLCPHDTRKKGGFNGCFYTCVFKEVFDSPRMWPDVDREEALERIDARIEEYKQQLKEES